MANRRITYKRPAPRKIAGTMNKLEDSYAKLLEERKRNGEILDYRYEPVKLRLAEKTTYSPDFMVIGEHIEFHEVKGFMRDDAAVKLKVAAEMFPWFRFLLITRDKAQWIYKDYGS